jgi:hypothetical protein
MANLPDVATRRSDAYYAKENASRVSIVPSRIVERRDAPGGGEIRHMHDQRIEGRPLLGGIKPRHRCIVGGIGAEAVDRFGWKRDEAAGCQHGSCLFDRGGARPHDAGGERRHRLCSGCNNVALHMQPAGRKRNTGKPRLLPEGLVRCRKRWFRGSD